MHGAESIGFTYGLSAQDLPNIELIYLGKRQSKPAENDLISILATTYTSRRWFVGSAAIDINFERRPLVIVLKSLSEELKWLRDQNLPFDKAELRFLLEILGRLQSSDCLPLLGVWYIGKALRSASPSANDELAVLITRFNRLFSVVLDQAINRHPPAKRGHYLLTITFKSRPKLPLDMLVAGALKDGELNFVKGYEGSWVEIWEASHNAVFTIDLLLVMTLGVSRSLEEAVRGFRSMMATVRRPAKPRVQRVTSQADLAVMLEGPVAFAAQEARKRHLRFSPEAVRRVDAALAVLSAMSDEELAAFLDYGPPKVQKLTVRPVGKRPKKRSRAPQPSA